MRRETRDRTYNEQRFSDDAVLTEFEQFLLNLESNGTVLARLETRELSDAEFLHSDGEESW